MTSTKNDVRTHYRETRGRHHRANENQTAHPELVSSLEEILRLRAGPSVWAAYSAHRSEFNLAPAIEILRVSHPEIRWAFPRVTTAGSLEFYIPRASEWIANSFSILEPNPETSEAIAVSKLAGVFVPGLAFDRLGNRIGSGKGYYDRALSEYRGLRIGVGYSVQISDETFSAEQHDIQMDLLLTEQGVIKCAPSKIGWQMKG